MPGPHPVRIGALISGGGTNLQAIIDACQSEALSGRMVFVGTDNPKAYGLQRAEKAGIPTFVVDYGEIIARHRRSPEDFPLPADADLQDLGTRQHLLDATADPHRLTAFLKTRVAAEAELLAAMDALDFDLLVLAGFMRNLTPYFIDRVNRPDDRPRIMNIHPALLPAFPGTDGYGDTLRYGCKVGGCTVHFIDYGEDSGPIIGQRCFPIAPGDDLAAIQRKGLEQEWKLYPECIQLFADGRLSVVTETHTLGGGRSFQRKVVRIGPLTAV